MVSIFTYGFEAAVTAFRDAGVTLYALTNYEVLIQAALTRGLVTAEQENTLLNWRRQPAEWGQ
jgi:orotate phosphoribosyltransferase